jgi:glycosyltransferase involved in cell wall biosynthesis
MKIIQLVDTLEAGGTERMAVNMANTFTLHGIANGLIVTRKPHTLLPKLSANSSLLCTEKKSRWDVNTFICIYKWIKRENVDILHAHSTTLFWATIVKLLSPNIKLVWHDHYGNRKKSWSNPLYIFLSLFVNKTIAINEEVYNWHKKYLFTTSDSKQILPNFVALSAIDKTQRKRNQLIIIANLLPVKNHHLLLAALHIVKQKKHTFHLDMIGKIVDPQYAESVFNQIRSYELEKDISYHGQAVNIEPYLSKASIGILCSLYEGLPMSLLEYGMAELGVISTNVGQCSLLLDHKGWLVEKNNPEKLANALIEALSNDQLLTQNAISLYNYTLMHHSAEAFIKQYINFIKPS